MRLHTMNYKNIGIILFITVLSLCFLGTVNAGKGDRKQNNNTKPDPCNFSTDVPGFLPAQVIACYSGIPVDEKK